MVGRGNFTVHLQPPPAAGCSVALNSLALPLTSVTHCDSQEALATAVKAEFAKNGKWYHYQQGAYNYVMSIPPTSMEAERAFSAAGILCTKMCSSLSDKSSDTLFYAFVLASSLMM